MNNVNFYNGEPFRYHGTHDGVDYWIVSYGYHPCVYVQQDQIRYNMIYHDYECHGGITFRGEKKFAKGFEYVIGWDYDHLGLDDYSTLYANWDDFDLSKLKRWTFSEVEKEIFEFIDKYKKN